MTFVPKDPVVDGLATEFAAIEDLATRLDAADWTAPTSCPGWNVRAHLAHMIGTESALSGEPTPDITVDPASAAYVRNDIGAANERWVQSLARVPMDELIDRFRDITSRRLVALGAMDQDSWDTEGFTPAGRDTYGRFMRIRVFDCWMHEQDMRDATGRPGHDSGAVVELVLDEMLVVLGYIVGKKASAPPGSSVTFALTGPASRTVHVAVGDRAAVVPALDGPADVTLRMPVGVFARLGGGRIRPRDVADQIEIVGDEKLGTAILENFAYTI